MAAGMLTAELALPDDELAAAVRGFLALALADLGREREALALSLDALSTYLPRDNRSVARYAAELAPASGRAPNAPRPPRGGWARRFDRIVR